jgi:hypothetical protein
MKLLKDPIQFNEKRPKPKRTLIKSILTTEEWETINKYADLPIEAKKDIEKAIADYHFQTSINQETLRPYQVKDELKRLADLAKELKNGLYHPISHELIYAVGSVGGDDGPYARAAHVGHFNDIRKQAGILFSLLQKASRKIKAKQPGSDTTYVDQLIRTLDDILYRYTNKGVNRGKKAKHYIEKVMTVTDPKIGSGSIHEALVRLARAKPSRV